MNLRILQHKYRGLMMQQEGAMNQSESQNFAAQEQRADESKGRGYK